jgi:hypothetical protein
MHSTMTHENKVKKNESSMGIVNYESSLEMYSKSVKPNRGDRTPKSNSSSRTNKNLENNMILSPADELNSSISIDGISIPDATVVRVRDTIQTKDKIVSLEREVRKTRKSYSKLTSSKANKYDITQLVYEANTVYIKSKKPSVDNNFLKRMNKDISSRKEKEKKINEMVDFRKAKGTESARIKTFNGLIDDANRRLQAKDNFDKNVNSLKTQKTIKNYSQKNWDKIYNNRFLNYKNLKDSRLEEKIIENERAKKCNEDKVVEEMTSRVKKASYLQIENHVNKLYKDAERRRLSHQNKLVERNNFENMQKDNFKHSTDKFKSFSPVSLTFI